MGTWWPLDTHSIAGAAAAEVRFEGRLGGRVVEVAEDGSEHVWADVLTWDLPHRVVPAWHPSRTPVAASVIDVRFRPVDRWTVLRLEHREWEEFGAQEGVRRHDEYEAGWDIVLAPYEARSRG